MAEGYLSQGAGQQPQQPQQASPEQQPQGQGQGEPETILAVNAMKVMYSEKVWPDIERMIQKGLDGCIKAVVMIAVNILRSAQQGSYKPSDDELLDAAGDIVDDVVELGLRGGSLQGNKDDLMADVMVGAISGVNEQLPGVINMEALQQIAAQATPEDQQAAQRFAPQQAGQPQQGAQPQSQPQMQGQ